MIEMLKRLSPVPIEFVDEMIDWGYSGMFWDEKGSLVGHPYIEILDSLEEHEKIAVLAHEIGHAICKEKNCECFKVYKKNPALVEIHAYKYDLNWLLKHKQKRALKYEIRQLELHVENRSDHYTEAAKHIMKLKLWQKCLDYVK